MSVTEKSRKRTLSSLSDDSLHPDSPDGGYGWVIVFASFMVHAIADGISFATGELYEELLEEFDASSSATAWMNGLMFGMPLLLGPVAGACTERFGCRNVAFVGSAVAGIGCALSSFANSLEMFVFTFGFICGCGLAFVFMPAVVIVAFYFEKKRAFATGIAVCGSGVGTAVMAPVVNMIVNFFGLKGAMLILSGVLLNMCVFCCLFRDLEFVSRNQSSASSQLNINPDSSTPFLNVDSNMKSQFTHSLVEMPTYIKKSDFQMTAADRRLHVSKQTDPVYPHLCGIKSQQQKQASSSDQANRTVTNADFISGNEAFCRLDLSIHNNSKTKNLTMWERQKAANNRRCPTNPLIQRLRTDIFYRGSGLDSTIKNLPSHATCPDLTDIEEHQERKLHQTGFLSFIRQVFTPLHDLTLLRNWPFALFFFSNTLLYMNYDVFYIYLVGQMSRAGIETQWWVFVSILGLSSVVGQVALGWLGDRPSVSPDFIFCFCIIACGIISAVEPLRKSALIVAIFCALFGFTVSANYALSSEVSMRTAEDLNTILNLCFV